MQRVCEPKGSAQSGQNFRKRSGQNLRNPQDFGTLLAARNLQKPSVILFRGPGSRKPDALARAILSNLSQLTDALEHGSTSPSSRLGCACVHCRSTRCRSTTESVALIEPTADLVNQTPSQPMPKRRAPVQNAYIERFIGSVRRECLDHVIVCSASGLRRVLRAYVEHYLHSRTHLSLDKTRQSRGRSLRLPMAA
jgi:hypothetical protein